MQSAQAVELLSALENAISGFEDCLSEASSAEAALIFGIRKNA
jgi:hypothetical protein